MNSTRTRVESTTGMNVPEVESPIAKKMPDSLHCQEKDCNHIKVYRRHFEREQWISWVNTTSQDSGECEYCAQPIKPSSGVTASKRKTHHIC